MAPTTDVPSPNGATKSSGGDMDSPMRGYSDSPLEQHRQDLQRAIERSIRTLFSTGLTPDAVSTILRKTFYTSAKLEGHKTREIRDNIREGGVASAAAAAEEGPSASFGPGPLLEEGYGQGCPVREQMVGFGAQLDRISARVDEITSMVKSATYRVEVSRGRSLPKKKKANRSAGAEE
ncbi:c8d5dbb3-f4f9-4414-820c-8fdbdfe9dfac [Thermothielavioides terrestris]|uniref:Uncharacterized protein n=2 Tax=Thermothielavioides terrestris TaxID=2587410 RepID=G2R5Y8_THETT|nr:uncharacterized protein THITE_2089888 [Thermothielavioides terrestris NRRL 8126]AEO68375.1 hypothetical protein THITE_2089888 [Thermothielavioides terrestris NRRL 8126]SPQ24351.1 c8d5dbb3-f4f9-4414-820c-8fdbdfe9dfac [Thermothielavioides terrestris]